ncbi:MAG: hypothetical protein HYX43_04635 [Burkholderiales bacterium]|nr:hypothetical protein [Burkholderiales bacterium]
MHSVLVIVEHPGYLDPNLPRERPTVEAWSRLASALDVATKKHKCIEALGEGCNGRLHRVRSLCTYFAHEAVRSNSGRIKTL